MHVQAQLQESEAKTHRLEARLQRAAISVQSAPAAHASAASATTAVDCATAAATSADGFERGVELVLIKWHLHLLLLAYICGCICGTCICCSFGLCPSSTPAAALLGEAAQQATMEQEIKLTAALAVANTAPNLSGQQAEIDDQRQKLTERSGPELANTQVAAKQAEIDELKDRLAAQQAEIDELKGVGRLYVPALDQVGDVALTKLCSIPAETAVEARRCDVLKTWCRQFEAPVSRSCPEQLFPSCPDQQDEQMSRRQNEYEAGYRQLQLELDGMKDKLASTEADCIQAMNVKGSHAVDGSPLRRGHDASWSPSAASWRTFYRCMAMATVLVLCCRISLGMWASKTLHKSVAQQGLWQSSI